MNASTQENAAGAEESSATSETLSSQAKQQNGMVLELMDVFLGKGRKGSGSADVNRLTHVNLDEDVQPHHRALLPGRPSLDFDG